jgi:hypothetical protein
VCRWGADSVLEFLRPIVEAGLSSVLLFGVPANLPKVKRSYLEFLFKSFFFIVYTPLSNLVESGE